MQTTGKHFLLASCLFQNVQIKLSKRRYLSQVIISVDTWNEATINSVRSYFLRLEKERKGDIGKIGKKEEERYREDASHGHEMFRGA